MKLISWNVNGLRACITHGFYDFLKNENPDIIGIQETKVQENQIALDTYGYYQYFNSAIKKGYSGTLVLTKKEPLSVHYGLSCGSHNDEGRTITLEFEDFYFVTLYSPNSKEELKRLDYRMEFEDELRNYLISLKNKKNVILCGDLNVAHNEIDLKNPESNHFNPGFSDQERNKFTTLLNSGFIDTFRYLYNDRIEYSWWSYRFNARLKNIGWRIDYFLVNNEYKNKIKDAIIYKDIFGSDHCPVGLILE